MYWLSSRFEITCSEDLKLLARIYKNVSGEIKNGLIVEWCDNPFEAALLLYKEGTKCVIEATLVGPQTLRAVSEKKEDIKSKRFNDTFGSILNVATFIGRLSKSNISVADAIKEIEKDVGAEMKRTNDLGYVRNWTEIKKFQNYDDLLTVICMATNVDFIFQTSQGFMVANKKSVYNTWIPINKGNSIASWMYDKDDGFKSFCENDGSKDSLIYKELQQRHDQWKNSNFKNFV